MLLNIFIPKRINVMDESLEMVIYLPVECNSLIPLRIMIITNVFIWQYNCVDIYQNYFSFSIIKFTYTKEYICMYNGID